MYDISDTLKNKILLKIPEDYSNIEKAIFIYYELCKTLQYSIEYFIDESNNKEKFINIENLKYVDGEQNKNVVCFTFNAIFLKLLDEAGICNVVDYNGVLESDNNFSSRHNSATFIIDGTEYNVDATFGILYDNDLTLSKYSTHRLQGWSDCENIDEINAAIEKIQKENRILENSALNYVQQKKEDFEYKALPLEMRKRIFLERSIAGPDYSIETFNYLFKLKHLFFQPQEIKNYKDIKVELLFVKDMESVLYKAILFFNPEGYTNDKGYEDFEHLETFVIDLKSREISQLSIEEIRHKFNSKQYVARDNEPTNAKMLEEGEMRLTPIYSGGEGIFDINQKPTNLKGYIRTIVETGEKIHYDTNLNPIIKDQESII